MRVGILGAGNISQTHARAAASLPGVEVVAVHSTNPEKTARLARHHRAAPYDSLEKFLAHRPMDIVAIGTPSGCHATQAIAAVQHGLHVLVEKPVDITTARVDALIAAADAARVTVGVFFQDRLKPAVTAVKSMLDAGELGTPILASGHVKWYRPPDYYATSRWRGTWALDGGGALMNQGIHTVDLLLWFFGPVAEVMGRTATRLHAIEAEDTAAAVLEFENGSVGVIEAATSVYPGFARRIELTGSQGSVVIEGDDLIRIELQGKPGVTDVQGTSAGASSPVVADIAPHTRIFEDFLTAIRTGRRPACDAREGRRSVALVQAVYASARSGVAEVPR